MSCGVGEATERLENTSQFILQPFFRFSYVKSSSLNSLGEPPMGTFKRVKLNEDKRIIEVRGLNKEE